MNKQAPGLIQRAAARLQQSRTDTRPIPADANTDAAPAQPAYVATHFEPIEKHARPALSGHERQVTISPATLAANGITLPSGGFSRTTEEFRALKRYVLNNVLRSGTSGNQLAKRIVLVTSARAGEGKTFNAVNLALALAYEKDARVLLMDADAYRQSLMGSLGISANAGWLDMIAGGSGAPDEYILRTNIPNFSVLPSGKERAEIPELMASRHMGKLLDELVAADPARFIVIDSLPCLASTEPAILAALAGQTLFVVAAHQTSKEDVESSLRLLHASQSVSLVLNRAEPLLTEQFKGYGYGYGYGNQR
ncbi:MAG TPA: AAA family ATPase [Rhizomicrobium sp.]|jgi:receptor protein-tyrosine kinase|nr:AAA family ATPase [Rhizomicrobium sp.]